MLALLVLFGGLHHAWAGGLSCDMNKGHGWITKEGGRYPVESKGPTMAIGYFKDYSRRYPKTNFTKRNQAPGPHPLASRGPLYEILKDTDYVTRHNVSCPASGFFFQREMGPNSLRHDMCYLCFCQDNITAVCWRRMNRGCDLEHYHDISKRYSRARRSPLSLGEVFLRDAARDFFNKQSPEQCKPFESSFSDGCPPADWCIGCTVCDCDANGHWDCHVLSFCADKNGKRQMKKRKGHPKDRLSKRHSKTSTTAKQPSKNTTKPPKKPARKRFVNPNMKRNQVKQSSAVNKHKIEQVKATKVNKFASVKKPLPKIQSKKAIPHRNRVTSRPVYIKKNVSTNKPTSVTSRSVKNNTVEVAQQVVKQFMSTIQKMIKNIDLKTNKTSNQANKVLKKRSMVKQDNNKDTNESEKKTKFVAKTHNSNTSKYGRIKRQVAIMENTSLKKDSNYSNNWNATNSSVVYSDRTQHLIINNTSNSTLNVPNSFQNQTVNLKNSMNREIYVTDDDIHVVNQYNIVKDGALYNAVNNTRSFLWTIDNTTFQKNTPSNKVEDIIFLTTELPYVSTNFMQFNNNNRNGVKKSIIGTNADPESVIFKIEKQYSNISTQTDNHTVHSCKFRTLLQKLIGTDTEQYNNTIRNLEASKKPKRYTILNKIKRLFKKIFNKKNKNKYYHKDNLYYSDYDMKQSVFTKSRSCKLDTEEKDKLRQRMYTLKSESENILKTIGIIKGLLHILEINTNEMKYKLSNESYGSNKNINKLNIIIKNAYYEGQNGKKLTDDQQTQIKYIKENVQVFIKSIGTFARVLDDIVQIATCRNKKEYKMNNTKINKNYNAVTHIANDFSNSTQTKLEKLKKLIYNYNILQNKFIHQIYVILSNLETNVSDKNNYKFKLPVHSQRQRELNKTDAIETNSANIINNIRKLKLLAERINVQRRRKRESIDDDDALEYLLILMEYLLKRHGPTYSSVNDGLDLLIEAIKSAPDIKIIRKKVLNNITEKYLVTRTTTPINSFKKYNDYSNSNRIREWKNNTSEYRSGKKYKMNVTEQSEDDVNEDEDKIEEIYRSFKNNKHSSSEQTEDDILLGRSNVSYTSESYYNIQQETTTRMNNIRDSELLRYKTVDNSLEEDVTTTRSKTMAVESDTTPVSPVTDNSNVKFKNQVRANSNTDDFLIDPKANIDWIEENFKEIKQSREIEAINQVESSTPKNLIATRTHKRIENISDVTNETVTNVEKKMDNTSAEEIISKKQLNLLNSLDYVDDEADSKDDKFLSDSYV